MAKLVGDAAGLTRRVFKQAAYIYTKNGQAYLNKWPKKPSGPVSQKLQDARDLMRERSLAIKAMPFRLTDFSTRYSKHTMLMPRDWLFMGLAGRYIRVWLPPEKLDPANFMRGAEGYPPEPPLPPDYNPRNSVGRLRPIYSMAGLTDLSDLFDIYGDAVGTTFYRTSVGWRGLAPGNAGDVLTILPSKELAWRPPGGGGGGGYQKLLLSQVSPPSGVISWPLQLSWGAAIVDDFNGWDPLVPERIRLPVDTIAYRIGLSAIFLNTSSGTTFFLDVRDWSSGSAVTPSYQHDVYYGAGGFNNRLINFMGPFLPPPEEKDVYIRINRSQSANFQFNAPLYLTVEIIRSGG